MEKKRVLRLASRGLYNYVPLRISSSARGRILDVAYEKYQRIDAHKNFTVTWLHINLFY